MKGTAIICEYCTYSCKLVFVRYKCVSHGSLFRPRRGRRRRLRQAGALLDEPLQGRLRLVPPLPLLESAADDERGEGDHGGGADQRRAAANVEQDLLVVLTGINLIDLII